MKGNESRIDREVKRFRKMFGDTVEAIAQAPGRAEILGCHTDYNHGFALAAGITRNTRTLLSKRDDANIAVCSTAFPKQKIVKFSLTDITRDETVMWTNYVRAVVKELVDAGYKIGGANVLIDSTVPKSGGVSSSAALELAVAFGLLALYKQDIDRTKVALLCKTAENSDIVRSPCGFLDQGAAAFAKKDAMVFLDFLPKGNSPVSRIDLIPAIFPVAASFVIPVDPTLERQLGESGYVVRRKMCEDSLPFWTDVLGKKIRSLRDVTRVDFETHRARLEKKNPVMRKRVEHIIYENERVLAAVEALKKKDIHTFGNLLTEAGKSSIELYELDENTPQLTFLIETGRSLQGVFGMRNMGGGFSAIGLALFAQESMAAFQKALRDAYQKKFSRTLDFIEFSPSKGADIIHHA